MTIPSPKIEVFITGANGQLASALKAVSSEFPKVNCVFMSKDILDITDTSQVYDYLVHNKPDIIINTAAYTAVDKAETDREKANLLNGKSVGQLGSIAKKLNIGLIHISTDYVFDGTSEIPYSEGDKPNPQTVYGRSKLSGEQKIIDTKLEKYAIVRTSWLYSEYGANFVKTMLHLSRERSEISVVSDQIGSPTWANDLAHTLLRMALQLDKKNSGVYHYANKGEVSWYAFAKAIFSFNNTNVHVTPIPSNQYPTAAKRPQNSVLNCTKIESTFGVAIPNWEESLKTMIGNQYRI